MHTELKVPISNTSPMLETLGPSTIPSFPIMCSIPVVFTIFYINLIIPDCNVSCIILIVVCDIFTFLVVGLAFILLFAVSTSLSVIVTSSGNSFTGEMYSLLCSASVSDGESISRIV